MTTCARIHSARRFAVGLGGVQIGVLSCKDEGLLPAFPRFNFPA